MYVNSDQIKIYPTANRLTDKDPYANLNLEKHIVDISNNITDINNYIIEENPVSITGDTLTINNNTYIINGYNIRIVSPQGSEPTLDLSNQIGTKYIIASIKLTGSGDLVILDGYDNNSNYTGFEITLENNLPSINTKLSLAKIARATTSDPWVITQSKARMKFKSENVNIKVNQDTGLSKNNGFDGVFGDWLKSDFIIDDGEI